MKTAVLFGLLLMGLTQHAFADVDFCNEWTDPDSCQTADCSWQAGLCGPSSGGDDTWGCWADNDENSCDEEPENLCSWNPGYCYTGAGDDAIRALRSIVPAHASRP